MFNEATLVVWGFVLRATEAIVPAPQAVTPTCGFVDAMRLGDNTFGRIVGDVLGLAQAFAIVFVFVGLAFFVLTYMTRKRSTALTVMFGALGILIFLPVVLNLVGSLTNTGCSFF